MKETFVTTSIRHDPQSGLIDISLVKQGSKKKRGETVESENSMSLTFKGTLTPAMTGDHAVAKQMRKLFIRQLSVRLGNAIMAQAFPDDTEPTQ